MGRPHGPAQLRAFLRLLKQQGPLEPLLAEAMAIEDPAHGARALAAWAAAAPQPLRQQALEAVGQRLGSIQREAQVAETVPEVLKQVGRGPEATLRDLLQPLLALPDGEALSHGVRKAAKAAPESLRELLFARALSHRGQETADAKAVLRSAFTRPADLEHAQAWRTRIGRIEDDDLRIRLQGFLHHQVSRIDPQHPAAAGSLQDVVDGLKATETPRREDLWKTVARDAADLRPLLDAAHAEPPAMQAEALLAVGVQADRRGDPALAASAFDAVEALLPALGTDPLVAGKLETARQRASGGSTPEAAQETGAGAGSGPGSATQPPPQRPLPPATGHALALCNTYTGGIKEVHFRAVARAAPLCAAFGLDLVLLGFPTPLRDLVARTARETRIGGEPWIVRLHQEGRVHEGPLEPSRYPALWERYTWIATSERAAPERQVGLNAAHPLCLVMGVGPQGLPRRLQHACHGEYEITGHGIGLETATAMGILADRLARLQQNESPP